MDSDLYKQVVDVMVKVQTNPVSQQRYQILLLNLYKETDPLQFYECFHRIVKVLLNADPKSRNDNVDRVLQFCASFCGELESYIKHKQTTDDEESLTVKVFNFLLDVCNINNDTVRFRTCQMINILINNLRGLDFSEELCESIENCMLERLPDIKSSIRLQAIDTLYRLQDPLDSNCRIIPELIQRMNGDSSGKVRKMCVEKIAIRRDVVVALVSRTRDVIDDVRFAAFSRLAKLVKYLKISERHQVIMNGFLDSCKEINKFMESRLVTNWLSDYDNDYLKLLEAMRLDSSETLIRETTKVIEYIVNVLLSCRPFEEILAFLKIDENRLLSLNDLKWVSVICWRCITNTCRKSDKYETLLESLLPDLVDFAEYIWRYCNSAETDSLEFQSILNEFFLIMQGYDVADVASRQSLTRLITSVLQEVNCMPHVTPIIIKNAEKVHPSVNRWTQFVCNIISNIMYVTSEDENKTAEVEFAIAKLKVRLNSVSDQLNSAVHEEDYESAATYKEELSSLKSSLNDLQQSLTTQQPLIKKTDSATILKSLNIARGMLISQNITALTPALRTLTEDVILEFLTHEDSKVRLICLECYTLCCIVDRKHAEKGIHIFSATMLANAVEQQCEIEYLLIAIKAINDLIVIYGPTLLHQPEECDEFPVVPLTSLIKTIVDLMDNENVQIQECASLSLCNLISYGRIQSASLISRMILKWCNPASDVRLQQHIGMMLEEFPTLVGSAEQLEKAVLPTITSLIKAPKSSPLSEVNIQNVVKLMLTLCSLCEEDPNLHAHLAVSFCTEMKNHHEYNYNFILSKTLLMLNIPPDNKQLIKDLINICSDLKDDIQNRMIANNINKFTVQLESLNTHRVSIIQEELEE